MNRAEIEKVLTDRMGEYFRPGTSSWRLNPKDLAGVVADILGDALDGEADQVSHLLPNTADEGYRKGRSDAVWLLRNHAERLRGEE